jgi:hypothetical protein
MSNRKVKTVWGWQECLVPPRAMAAAGNYPVIPNGFRFPIPRLMLADFYLSETAYVHQTDSGYLCNKP